MESLTSTKAVSNLSENQTSATSTVGEPGWSTGLYRMLMTLTAGQSEGSVAVTEYGNPGDNRK